MNKRYITTLLIVLLAPAVQADTSAAADSNKDTAGLGIGALVGGILGGPVGAIAGAGGGAWLGAREAERDQQHDQMAGDLAARTAELEHLRSKLAALEDQPDNMQPVRLDRRQKSAEQISHAINVAVYFRTDSSELVPAATDRLQDLAGYLAEHPQIRIHLAGYADRRGSPTYNLELSRRRAESVARMLEQAGLARERIHIEAHGQADAEAKAGDLEGYVFDRRVNIALSLTDPV